MNDGVEINERPKDDCCKKSLRLEQVNAEISSLCTVWVHVITFESKSQGSTAASSPDHRYSECCMIAPSA